MPGDDDKKRQIDAAVDDAMSMVRVQRSSKRNLYLIIGLLIIVVLARQTGFFANPNQGIPLPEVEMAQVDTLLADAPVLPQFGTLDGAAVRIVEFFDYACGHCRRMATVVDEITVLTPDIGVAMVEFPILGRESQLAARYALAAELQGGYGPYHRALMFSTVPFTDEGLMDLGKNLGLDAELLKADAYGEVIDEALAYNRQIALAVGVDGTPSFIIGDILIVGALEEGDFLGLIAAQRNP
ncbi:MAG: DsbA family protein [Alphaproteobacteria bacterium]|nr:DsbA family protein [Rhodospirillaceae bacterium]MBT6509355.1 DsbA family protein [Rhodospirillaceae bacterium]MBT7611754.1 DsbA family protein [Rhodospirillaceae bacterium]MBT7648711.1 DsbA family protein [Rhodospirillaceae bacterium]MDG2483063.1 DsbA family protein [Alphaproteobacteria bacterium]